MGANFISACHKCKVYTLHLRSKEDVGRTLAEFFHDHYNCGKADPKNLTVHWDYLEEPHHHWDDVGYEDVFDKYYPDLLKERENG